MDLAELVAMPKVDAHAHLVASGSDGAGGLLRLLERHGMRWLAVCLYHSSEESLERQIAAAQRSRAAHPERFSWSTAFSLQGFGRDGWVERAIGAAEAGAARGAVGVKVWKNIGMELRDDSGRYVMIDDPRFDPVLETVRELGLTLTAHIGEPMNCWLPVDKMTVHGDRSYFREHPEYHGLLHPEIPDHGEQVRSCDRMLARHPGLRVVWCHLGSREYDVREVARCLDRFPDLAVDLAGRVCHLQVQPREVVRDFMLRYQDRILYGTDACWGAATDQGAALLGDLERAYLADYRYFAAEEEVEAPDVGEGYTCRGLALPDDALRKLFRDNARRWYPGL